MQLPAGKARSSIWNDRVHAHRQARDLILDSSSLGGLPNLIHGKISSPADVVKDVAAEHPVILQDDAQLATNEAEIKVPQVASIVKDVTRHGAFESEQQTNQCGFSTTRRTDHSHKLTWLDRKIHAIQHERLVWSVAEAQIAHVDTAGQAFRIGAGQIALDGCIENGTKAFVVGNAFDQRDRCGCCPENADKQLAEGGIVGDECASIQIAVQEEKIERKIHQRREHGKKGPEGTRAGFDHSR